MFATSCPRSLASASGGGGISCTAPTATGGRSATSPSVFSAPCPAQSSTHSWCGSGPDDVVFFVHTYDLTPAEHVQLEARGVRIVRGEIARLVVEDDLLTALR